MTSTSTKSDAFEFAHSAAQAIPEDFDVQGALQAERELGAAMLEIAESVKAPIACIVGALATILASCVVEADSAISIYEQQGLGLVSSDMRLALFMEDVHMKMSMLREGVKQDANRTSSGGAQASSGATKGTRH